MIRSVPALGRRLPSTNSVSATLTPVSLPFSPDELHGGGEVGAFAAFLVRAGDLEQGGERRPRLVRRHARRAAACRSPGWSRDAAWCRCAVPRQSAPVSPPPRMTTCLPAALIWFSHGLPRHHPVGRHEVVHGEVDAVEVAARDRQVTRDGGAGGDHDGVVPAAQLLPRHVGADGRRRCGSGCLRPSSARAGGPPALSPS